MTETYELEDIINEFYKLEETFGYPDTFIAIHKDLTQNKVHNLVSRLRIWKENNYDRLRIALNTWNTSDRLLKGEISEEEPRIEDIINT